ncbi:MAG: glycosyltransferase family 4 protein [Candidatus Krumholzibacteria bacterium]|nr:glycosyltransferase family 4 protein [Candidatus Krumholzibacteria bacterium]
MKILQLCAVDFTAYHLLRPLGLALRDSGYEVSFCCSPGEGLDRLEQEGFDVYRVPISRSYNIISHTVSLVRLFRLMRGERFDIVHTHTPVAGLLGRIAAKITRVPWVVYSAHGFYFHEDMRGPVRRVMRAIERFGASISDLIFVQSGEDLGEAVESRIAPAEKLVHIGNGVDPSLFGREVNAAAAALVREEFGIDGGPVIGFTGRIVREKGAVEFVKAAGIVSREISGAMFVMIGASLESDRDGCHAEIESLMQSEGLSGRLVMTGYRKDVPAILALFDIFSMPSYREGMPRSLLEAMATGLPVVATDIRGCREEVIDGETGLLVPPRDHYALGEAVLKILSDNDMAARMGKTGRQRVLDHFDERAVTRHQIDRLDALTGRK